MQKITEITLQDVTDELNCAFDFIDAYRYSAANKPAHEKARNIMVEALADHVATAQCFLDDYITVQKVKKAHQTATPHPTVIVSISI